VTIAGKVRNGQSPFIINADEDGLATPMGNVYTLWVIYEKEGTSLFGKVKTSNLVKKMS
jgi:hypothetical protein